MTSVPETDIAYDFSADPLAAENKVNGAQLQAVLRDLYAQKNALLVALQTSIRDDNTLADALVRLRNLHDEILLALASQKAWQPKVAVACATTANIALTGEQTIDGVTTSASRVLVKDQSAPSQNGLYISSPGAWTRATDGDGASELDFALVYVAAGGANGGTSWLVTASGITIGTSTVPWAQVAGVSSSMLQVISTGSTASRTLEDRFADAYNVKDFGAKGDGTTDDTAAIQAAINAAQNATGKIVYLPPGNYRITSTLVINQSGVQFTGANADTNHNVTSADQGTILSWHGATHGTMLQVCTPNGASSPTVSNVLVKGIKLAANGVADIALECLSLGFCAFEDLNIYNPRLEAIHLGCQTETEITALRRCTFKRIGIRCLDGAAANAHGLLIDGSANGNVCFNTFEGLTVSHKDGDAIRITNADSNVFIGTYTFRVSGAGYGLSLFGGVTTYYGARSNLFIGLSANGGVYAYGTPSYAQPSRHNSIWFYDRENANPDPVVETGATLYMHDSSGTWEKPVITALVACVNRVNGESERANLTTESVRVRNDSDNHIRLVDQSANEWSVNINHSTGNLRLLRVAGTGAVELDADVVFNGHRVTYAAAAPGAGTWVAGDRAYNSAPAVGQPKSWVCTVGGTPGTWVSEGNL